MTAAVRFDGAQVARNQEPKIEHTDATPKS